MTSFFPTLEVSLEGGSISGGRRCKFSLSATKSGQSQSTRKGYLRSENILHPFQNAIPNPGGHHHLDCPSPLAKRVRLCSRSQHPRGRIHMVPDFRILRQRPLGLLNIAESPYETFDNSHVKRDIRVNSAVVWGSGAVLVALGKVDEEHQPALVGDFFQRDGVAGEACGDGFVSVIEGHAVLCAGIQHDCRCSGRHADEEEKDKGVRRCLGGGRRREECACAGDHHHLIAGTGKVVYKS